MKVVIVPDSFKGSATALEICDYMKKGVLASSPMAEVLTIPVADGGEGTVDAVVAATGCERVDVEVTGPFGGTVLASYAKIDSTAVIEMAQAAGLWLSDGRVEIASTYGVGEMILHALKNGAEKIILGLGGSATNDGGCGMAAALGAKFYRQDGSSYIPTGGTLCELAKVELPPPLNIEAMCDVDNPLCGINGASYVYGPQKGAKDVAALDRGLLNLAKIVGKPSDVSGAGAAGGMGYGVTAMFGGKLRSGIDIMLDIANFESMIEDADIVLTGEGRMDGQTARGKVPVGVARRSKGLPVVAICGSIGDGYEAAYKEGITAVFSACLSPVTLKEAMEGISENLPIVINNVIELFKLKNI